MGSGTNERARKIFQVLPILAAVFGVAASALAQQPTFKPGFNLFSTQQDIQLGKEASAEVDKEMPLIKDATITRYVSDLGNRLAAAAPNNAGYEWTFKVVDSQDLNAFALPGGYIYLNRGILEAADNEAQVAGVLAHEIGHVVMRHGTHQASQRVLAQMPLAILGGFLGQSGSITAQLAQMGIGLGVNSIFLKYSRGAESQSDEVGTYILHQSGYDPHAMAQFFEIIQKKYPQRTIEFFASHPNPENRVRKVEAFISQLGPTREGRTDSPEFQSVKKRVLAMPAPPKGKPAAQPAAAASAPPPAPSTRLIVYKGQGFSIAYPENWKVEEGKEGVTLAPEGGLMKGSQGEWAQAYGATIWRVVPKQGAGLVDTTQQLIESMRASNPAMRVVRQSSLRIRKRPAIATQLENDSPLAGQKETDLLITVRGGGAVLAVMFVVPQSAYGSYQRTFDAMQKSLDVR